MTNMDKEFKRTINQKKIDSRKLYRFTKRIFDIIMSAVALIILAIFFLIIAILIHLEDHGPAFYSQTRVGRKGKLFKIYKFRSMSEDADEKLAELKKYNEVNGLMFKMKDDPRITRMGKFLRKTSIDELPQLLNVLKGDMSLVGPRPPLLSEYKHYSDYDKQRLYVMPGCTGLWQATVRNNVGFEEMVKIDLDYINRQSAWLDLKIMFLTLKIMIFPNGAY